MIGRIVMDHIRVGTTPSSSYGVSLATDQFARSMILSSISLTETCFLRLLCRPHSDFIARL
jgi:hypothetical protein